MPCFVPFAYDSAGFPILRVTWIFANPWCFLNSASSDKRRAGGQAAVLGGSAFSLKLKNRA